MSEETERAGSGPEGNSAGIGSTAVALAMAGASRARADAFLKDQQSPIAAQLHHPALNQSHLAPAIFAEAKKHAPNRGRLHLKWSVALLYAGRRDEATKQFAIGSGLDLVTADRAELARVLMVDDDAGASSVGIVSRTTLVPTYRDPAFQSH